MAAEGGRPSLAIRTGNGLEFWCPDEKQGYQVNPSLPGEKSKNCRVMKFSTDGRYFAFANGTVVKILSTTDWQVVCTLPRPKVFYLEFSPKGNFIVTWETFAITKDKPEGAPNFYVYNCSNGQQVFATIQKKQAQWEPCWSADESLFGIMVGGEAHFYELNGENGFDKSVNKLGSGRNGILSIAPGESQPHLIFYVPGAKGTPSMCKMYKYPNLEQSQIIACKSLFQADRIEMLWNKRASGVLLLTSTEVDQSGASYYGKQALHFMSTKGDSFAVQLGKEGPIHSVAWSPKSTEFVVVYGYMPAKATLFNVKCDILHDFGEASRNSSYFNDFGNLLLLGGFGNLRGYVEVWDLNRKRQISSLQAPDSTLLEWSPTGDVFMTATTAPRLRISNGFKIWHYSGALLFETQWPQGEELLEVAWQKFSNGLFKEVQITDEKIDGIKSSQPEASKQVYQPPNVRLMKELGLDTDAQIPIIPGLPPGYTSQKKTGNSTKSNKQKKSQKMNSSPAENKQKQDDDSSSRLDKESLNQKKSTQSKNTTPRDAEKYQKVRHITKQLKDIKKLKLKQCQGEHLEANQIAKISKEAALIQELQLLKVSM